jgi:hypothetical protein
MGCTVTRRRIRRWPRCVGSRLRFVAASRAPPSTNPLLRRRLCLRGPRPIRRSCPGPGVSLHRREERRAGHAVGYFENNAPRMRYKWFRSRGLFIGSGAVESGCKASPASASNCPACTGPSPAPAPSPRSAASRSAEPNTRSVTHRATRRQPPDQPNPPDELGYLQNRHAPSHRVIRGAD